MKTNKDYYQIKVINNPLFGENFGHETNIKYFTDEVNNEIYNRLHNELIIEYLPFLGRGIDYGMGDICLEEDNDIFKFYIIDHMNKFDYEEIENIYSAIDKLINYYEENELVNDSYKMKEIIYQTLNLEIDNTLQRKK